jgi:hypothetical protein
LTNWLKVQAAFYHLHCILTAATLLEFKQVIVAKQYCSAAKNLHEIHQENLPVKTN